MSTPSEHVNCPVLVGHLNRLSQGTDEQKALAFQLIMILDDVEAIAELIDHQHPASRHALSRTENIKQCAARLQNLIVDVTTASDAVPVPAHADPVAFMDKYAPGQRP